MVIENLLVGATHDIRAQIRQQRTEIDDLTSRLRLTLELLQKCKKDLRKCKQRGEENENL